MTTTLSASFVLCQRELIRFLRQKNRVIGSLVTPIVFWVFIGLGMGHSFASPKGATTEGYTQYFFAGTVLLSLLFTAIFSTISVIEDRREGFLQGVLVAPVGRIAIGILPPALLLLVAGAGGLPLAVSFTLLMGASQGVISIVRGAVPLALFGASGYGSVLGVIATPVLLVNAAAPTVFTWIVDRWGWGVGRVSLLLGCSAAWLAMELMSRWYEKHRAAVAAPPAAAAGFAGGAR